MNELSRLVSGARRLGVELTTEQTEQFARYRNELLEWNRRFNLTAIRDPEQVETKHFLDSLYCLQAGIPYGCQMLEVGSGAGFPGLALKIARPDLVVTLIEATRKKAGFLDHMALTLGLQNVEVLSVRAEDFKRRDAFDLVVARALAVLPVLLELTLPFCRVGGRVLAMKKGQALAAEIAASERALQLLGGQLEEPAIYDLDGEERQIVVVKKVCPTPSAYPRRAGTPVKQPL